MSRQPYETIRNGRGSNGGTTNEGRSAGQAAHDTRGGEAGGGQGRSEGKGPNESPIDAGRPHAGQRGKPAQHQASAATGWPISLSFLGLIAVLIGSAPAMLAFPTHARWGVFPLVLAGWLVSLCLHEFGHAIVAYHCGDRSVRAKGYLTLDLLRYTHLQYSIVLPLVFLALGGIGLPGGAVYISRRALRGRLRPALVSAGGPIATLAVFLALLAILIAGHGAIDMALYAALAFLAFLQLTALIFNLLPVPGLDGWGILDPWLPGKLREHGRRWAAIAPLLLIVLLLVPPVNRAFWDGVYMLSYGTGLDIWAITLGRALFEFWR
jgi:Zn-dependent protease